MNEVDYLGTISIFSHLKNRDLRRIAKLSRQQRFNKGDVIIQQGERDGRFFIILTGEVEVIKNFNSKNKRSFGTLGPQSYFGEMALLFADFERSASVVAKKETKVLYVDQWDLREEILKHPMLAIELLQLFSLRINALNKSIGNFPEYSLKICGNCKKVRIEDGSWLSFEEYVKAHLESLSASTICPTCAKKS
jgi:CRP/FNR family transcriptional regulator, cyclic AMP receptor protein